MVQACLQGRSCVTDLYLNTLLTVKQCHTHQKVKDTPKRRREASHAKAMKTAICEEVKPQLHDDTPFSLDMGRSTMDEGAEQHHHGLRSLESMA